MLDKDRIGSFAMGVVWWGGVGSAAYHSTTAEGKVVGEGVDGVELVQKLWRSDPTALVGTRQKASSPRLSSRN